MIFSIHIPKTAGTSFRFALEALYGSRLALYYGVKDPKTTEGLRVPRKHLADAAAGLSERGFEVLHGHYVAADVAPLVENPSQIWTWLRDPVERTISHYEFFRLRPLELSRLADRVKSGELTIETFPKAKEVRDLQSRHLAGLDLASLGFVGVSEHFELGMEVLFGAEAPWLKMRYNATERETPIPDAARQAIARVNVRDMQLYCEGLRLFVTRLAEAGTPAGRQTRPGLMERLMRSVR